MTLEIEYTEGECVLPDFVGSEMPNIKIKSLYIENFKAYDNFYMDFCLGVGDEYAIKDFICFIGENGAGKSTALNAIQMLFQRYDGYDQDRIATNMGRCIRHVNYSSDGSFQGVDNFLIRAVLEGDCYNYEVSMDRNGFINDHPAEIKEMLYRLCYFARFDQELHQFQLRREKWDEFKTLFESVTSYEIEEIQDVFSSGDDPIQAEIAEKYVLGFTVKKPHETISHKECSNGERKVIKSFSTLLNLEIMPRIILIDDIAMHVALSRHMKLIDAMKRCYPDSQIFSTTHSYRMTKNLKKNDDIYDLRLMHADEIIKKEPWRLRIVDEIGDALYKLEGIPCIDISKTHDEGKKILDALSLGIKDLDRFEIELSNFLKDVSDLYVKGMLSYGM